MVYDFSEINPFAKTAGCLPFAFENEAYCIRQLAIVGQPCTVVRGNAEKLPWPDETFDAVVTDPPYYSSIFYADLSAFFYVWLRRLVGDLYPEHFTLPAPPKRREAVAQPSEHGGSDGKAEAHYRQLMEKAFAEARRVLKPGAPLVCVYAHKTTEGWASLIKALVPAGLTVTEAWPVQTEARGRTNALEAAALSDSIFFVARRREGNTTGQYEANVRPELERIARERVATLWSDGKGIGGADLLMAAVGAGLRPYTQFSRVEYATGEEVSAERYLLEVEGVVLDTMLEQVFGFSRAGVSGVDRLTRFYVLWRFTYRESSIEAGDAIVFCYPQGVELDGPDGLSGPAPRLVEKATKTTYRVRTFEQRGEDEGLGLPRDGVIPPLIDVLHRVLWLVVNKPEALPTFLREAQPNLEQLRLVAQALCGPVLKRAEASDASLTPELSALSKVTANWRSVVDAAAVSQEMEDLRTGQKKLSLETAG
jgi:putative DNA methylase